MANLKNDQLEKWPTEKMINLKNCQLEKWPTGKMTYVKKIAICKNRQLEK